MKKKNIDGIRLDEGGGTSLRSGNYCYWDAELQQIVMADLSRFCPGVEFTAGAGPGKFSAVFRQNAIGGKELCGTSKSIADKKVRIPEQDVDGFIRSLDSFLRKAEDPNVTSESEAFIRDFRVPDPRRMKKAWRVSDGAARHLIVLWGYTEGNGATVKPLTETTKNWPDAKERVDLRSALASVATIGDYRINWGWIGRWILRGILLLLLLAALYALLYSRGCVPGCCKSPASGCSCGPTGEGCACSAVSGRCECDKKDSPGCNCKKNVPADCGCGAGPGDCDCNQDSAGGCGCNDGPGGGGGGDGSGGGGGGGDGSGGGGGGGDGSSGGGGGGDGSGGGGGDSGNPGGGGGDSGNPGSGVDSGNPGSGVDSGNPGEGGADSGNPGGGDADSGNPGGGGADSGNPGGGGADSGNPGGGGADSGNPGGGGDDSGNPGGGGDDSGNPGGGGADSGNPGGGGDVGDGILGGGADSGNPEGGGDVGDGILGGGGGGNPGDGDSDADESVNENPGGGEGGAGDGEEATDTLSRDVGEGKVDDVEGAGEPDDVPEIPVVEIEPPEESGEDVIEPPDKNAEGGLVPPDKPGEDDDDLVDDPDDDIVSRKPDPEPKEPEPDVILNPSFTVLLQDETKNADGTYSVAFGIVSQEEMPEGAAIRWILDGKEQKGFSGRQFAPPVAFGPAEEHRIGAVVAYRAQHETKEVPALEYVWQKDLGDTPPESILRHIAIIEQRATDKDRTYCTLALLSEPDDGCVKIRKWSVSQSGKEIPFQKAGGGSVVKNGIRIRFSDIPKSGRIDVVAEAEHEGDFLEPIRGKFEYTPSINAASGTLSRLDADALSELGARVSPSVFICMSSDGAFGSAFAVHRRKLVTNAHVVGNLAVGRPVTLYRSGSQTSVRASVRAKDVRHDLALLELDAAESDLTPLVLSSAKYPRRRAPVAAIGFPGTAVEARSHISSDKPKAWTTGGTVDGIPTIAGMKYVRHDAEVMPGNSGGPLVNLNDGTVAGVNTLVTFEDDQGEAVNRKSLAVPTQTLRDFLERNGVR